MAGRVKMKFNKSMSDPLGKAGEFSVTKDALPIVINGITYGADDSEYDLFLDEILENVDVLTLTYTKGTVTSTDGGILESFTVEVVSVAIPDILYIAHRGGSLVYPENTMEAYTGMYNAGFKVIEQDVHLLLDGTPVVMHDETVDRTTTSVGYINTYTPQQWETLVTETTLQNWTNVSGPPFFEDVVSHFGNSVFYVPEAPSIPTEPIVDILLAHGIRDNVIIQTWEGLDRLEYAINAGMEGMFVTDKESYDPATIKSAGVNYIGLKGTTSIAYITSCINAGLKVIIWTVDDHKTRDRFIAYGVSGFFSDDPVYLSGGNYKLTSDPFSNQRMYHGFVSRKSFGVNNATYGNRGIFYSPNKWGYEPSTNELNPYDGCIQGWACPLNKTTYSIQFDVQYDSISDNTRWGSIAIAVPTDLWDDSAYDKETYGYHIILRANGQIGIYRVENGTPTLLQNLQTTALSALQAATIKVDVNPTDFTVTRVDTGHTTTITDSSYRGQYFALGRSGAIKAMFSNVSIT